MKQAHVSKLLGFMTGTLIAVGGLQAQIVGPPMPPIFPTPPITSTLPLVGVLATDPTALGGTSSGAFTLTLNAALPTNLPVTLAISGTASYTVDYNLETNGTVLAPIIVSTVIEPTNVVTIPAGFLAVDILVQPLPETVNTGNKTVVLGVCTNAGYQVLPGARRATVTIVDDVFNIPPPVVSITSPTDGSLFWFPASITVTADASDSGVAIRSVSFFANDDCLGKVTTSPYSLTWTNARPGRYALTALAFDVAGQSTLSAPVHIVVTNVVPVVKLTSPASGNFTLGSAIPMEATSSDALNPITNVTFYVNGRVVDSVANPTTTATTPPPYTYDTTFSTWTPDHAGIYIVQASVTDAIRNKVYSNRVMINVTKP